MENIVANNNKICTHKGMCVNNISHSRVMEIRKYLRIMFVCSSVHSAFVSYYRMEFPLCVVQQIVYYPNKPLKNHQQIYYVILDVFGRISLVYRTEEKPVNIETIDVSL